MRFSREFFEHFKRSLNATLKIGAMDVKEFRPISLIVSVYMTLAQVLANRLKAAFGKHSVIFKMHSLKVGKALIQF